MRMNRKRNEYEMRIAPMKRISCILILLAVSLALLACGTTREETMFRAETPVIPDTKLRVTDVSNKTGEIFDVDVIGNMWDALDASLYQRGILWDGSSTGQTLELHAEILDYQKGSFYLRNIVPPWGRTSIKARCIVTDGERVLASSETVQTITLGDGSFTTNAWRKIFKDAAEDLITQVLAKL